jgi:hypothetical protein
MLTIELDWMKVMIPASPYSSEDWTKSWQRAAAVYFWTSCTKRPYDLPQHACQLFLGHYHFCYDAENRPVISSSVVVNTIHDEC